MRSPAAFEDIYLHKTYVDMRKSINGLAQVVSGELERNPCDGGLFVFLSKNRRVMKCLYWDRTGFALWQKRLEKDRFRWPVGTAQDVLAISSEQMDWLLAGLDILKSKPHAELRFEAFS